MQQPQLKKLNNNGMFMAKDQIQPLSNQTNFDSVLDTLKLRELREKLNNPKEMPNLIFDWQTPKNGQVAMKQLVTKGEMDSRDAS